MNLGNGCYEALLLQKLTYKMSKGLFWLSHPVSVEKYSPNDIQLTGFKCQFYNFLSL